jgi:hypothetical protein
VRVLPLEKLKDREICTVEWFRRSVNSTDMNEEWQSAAARLTISILGFVVLALFAFAVVRERPNQQGQKPREQQLLLTNAPPATSIAVRRFGGAENF